MAAIDQLTGLANVIGMFSDKEATTTTKGTKTSTTKTNISDAGVSQLIDQILSGPGGVKSIGNAARSSGLYNSTTEQKALGELYSDAAVKAELARSPTTTSESGSTTSTTAQEGLGLGSLGLALGGGMLLNSLFGGASGKGGLGGLLSGLFGGGTGGGGASGSSIGALANLLGPESVKMLPGAGGVASTAGAGAAGSLMAPGFGSFLSGLLGGKDAAGDPLSLLSSAGAGFMAGGPLGALIAPLASLGGGFLGDASVICTALNKRGLISQDLHSAGHRYLVTLDPVTRMGYYLWAERIAKKIDAGSKFWRYAMVVPTWCYLTLIASDRGVLDHLENPIGSLVRFIGEPMCHFIGSSHIAFKMLED